MEDAEVTIKMVNSWPKQAEGNNTSPETKWTQSAKAYTQ